MWSHSSGEAVMEGYVRGQPFSETIVLSRECLHNVSGFLLGRERNREMERSSEWKRERLGERVREREMERSSEWKRERLGERVREREMERSSERERERLGERVRERERERERPAL